MKNKEYIDEGNSQGVKLYSEKKAIKVIKDILKKDDDILRNRKIKNISVDDILEIGHNFYCISKI